MKQPSKMRLAITGIILAIGFGAAWGFGLGGVGSFLSSLVSGDDPRDMEEIVVDYYGQPYIQVRVGGDYENIEYRTLEGKAIDLNSAFVLSPTNLYAGYRPPRLFAYPITWRERIAGLSNEGKPFVSWVFLRNGNRPGKAYFVGHHPRSNQRAGYIGRMGPRTSVPVDDEQFDVGDPGFTYGSNLLASTSSINFGTLGYSYSAMTSRREGQLEQSQVFLCDGDVVCEVNLRTREVRVVKEFDQLIGIAILGFTPQGALRDDERWPEQRLIIRCLDRLVVYNTFDDTEVEFKLPADVRSESLEVNTVGAEELLLHVDRGEWDRGQIVDLLRINTAGDIQEQQTVRLLSYVSNHSAMFSLLPASLTPTLLPWCLGMFVVAPLTMMQSYDVPDYAAGLNTAWDNAWPGLVLVFMVSCVLTAIVYRWQIKYSREQTLFWTVFVFLTTLPGFFAYWVMHRREPVAACPHCRADVPRDRDACAKCAAPFPATKLLGTEIYA